MGGTTYRLLVTFDLSQLILVDRFEVEKENQYDEINLEPVLTAIARDHNPQSRQDISPPIVHFLYQQKVNLSIQKRWYRDSTVVWTGRVLFLPNSQRFLPSYVETLGSKSGKNT